MAMIVTYTYFTESWFMKSQKCEFHFGCDKVTSLKYATNDFSLYSVYNG